MALLLWQPTGKRANVRIGSRPRRPASWAAWRTGDQTSSRLNGEGQTMDPVIIIIWLVIGAIAGWLAGQIVKGGGFGLVGDIVVGIIGAVVAGWLLPRIGLYIGGGFIAEIINAVIGAVILLVVVRLVKR
jgi:uncharacterized membrane protein YeaQ/YmgE (transglycosylase-associated protein family)